MNQVPLTDQELAALRDALKTYQTDSYYHRREVKTDILRLYHSRPNHDWTPEENTLMSEFRRVQSFIYPEDLTMYPPDVNLIFTIGSTVYTNFGYNNTTILGATVTLVSNIPPAYAPVTVDDSAVMMQGFFSNVPTNSAPYGDWYNVIATNAVDMATNGFTTIWMPPPEKGNSENGGSVHWPNSNGYDPYNHYDLGDSFRSSSSSTVNTRYGSKAELLNAISNLTATGIAPLADVVVNHMAGNTSGYYTNYPYFQKTPADFYIGVSNLVCYPFHRDIAFGDNEVNQTTPHMQQALEAWGEWLVGVIGFQGFRFDHSNGIEPWFQSEWLSRPASSGLFSVLEYRNGATPREMQTWINLVDQRASLFDFPLRDNYLVAMCAPVTSGFNMASLYHAGLAGVAPSNAVTFVENHDTCEPCSFGKEEGIKQDKILAYAYILASEGYPCVFYHDYYYSPNGNTNLCTNPDIDANSGFSGAALKPQIDKLVKARRLYAAGTTSFVSQPFTNDLYIAKRNGGGGKWGCILAINRSNVVLTVSIPTGTNSAVLIDRADTNAVQYSTLTTSSGTATNLSLPGRSYRVLAP